MIRATAEPRTDPNDLPKLPSWAASTRSQTPENLAFLAGSALAVLDSLVSDPTHGVPLKLLVNRLGLKAAVATSKLEGRLAREADIRDAYHLTPVGDDGRHARGPDGDLLAFWRGAVTTRLTGADWQAGIGNLIAPHFEADIAPWIESGLTHAATQTPLLGCVCVLRTVLQFDDRAERVACLLSDMVLARALNWPVLLPITARKLNKASLRALIEGDDQAQQAVQACILQSVQNTIAMARDLTHRASALITVAPKLRARGSDAAVGVFLSEDAVAPSTMLSPTIRGTSIAMTDRAARRFCDRLVELGVARELTGRPTFRLYGIA